MRRIVFILLFCCAARGYAAPVNEDWYFQRGADDLKVRDYRAAVEAYEKLLEIDPKNARAMLLLAEAYNGEGLTNKVIEEYERYLQLNPQNAGVALKEAELMRDTPAVYARDTVISYYKMSLDAQDNPDARLRYADYLAEKKESLPEAIEQYEIVLKADPQNAAAREGVIHARLWYAGVLSASAQELPKAIEQYQAVLALDPENKTAAEELAHLREWQASLLAQHEATLPQAIDILQKLKERRPSDEKVDSALTDMRLRYADTFGGDPQSLQESILLYKKLLDEKPGNEAIRRKWLDARMRHAEAIAERPDQLPEAIDEYKSVLNDDPHNEGAYRGYIHMRMRYAESFATDVATMPKAIALYEQLAKDEPDNPDVRRGLVRTRIWYAGDLSAKKETVPQAIEQYRIVLQEDPGNAKAASEIVALRLWYASVLGEKEETMSRALGELEALHKEYPENMNIRTRLNQMRLWYAGSLGAHKETLPQAVGLYQQVLREDPDNAEAHLGLARAYSWQGDADKAFGETQRAARSPWIGVDGRKSLQALQQDLAPYRKPVVSAEGQFFVQQGTQFSLRGALGGLHAKFDPTSRTTAFADVQAGPYWTGSQTAHDRAVSLGGQYRIHTAHQLEAEVNYHDITGGAEKDNDVLFHAQYGYGWPGAPLWLRVGAKREFKEDSFLSLVGQRLNGVDYGAARATLGFGDIGTRLGPVQLALSPYAGAVKARSLASNAEAGADASLDFILYKDSASEFMLGYFGQYAHYDQDQSGFTAQATQPLPGGYFSPQTFISHTPRLTYKYTDSWTELNLTGGPSFQEVKTAGTPTVHQLGGEMNLDWIYHFTEHWDVRLSPGFIRIATVYNRYYLNGFIEYTFTYPKPLTY